MPPILEENLPTDPTEALRYNEIRGKYYEGPKQGKNGKNYWYLKRDIDAAKSRGHTTDFLDALNNIVDNNIDITTYANFFSSVKKYKFVLSNDPVSAEILDDVFKRDFDAFADHALIWMKQGGGAILWAGGKAVEGLAWGVSAAAEKTGIANATRAVGRVAVAAAEMARIPNAARAVASGVTYLGEKTGVSAAASVAASAAASSAAYAASAAASAASAAASAAVAVAGRFRRWLPV